MTTANTGEVTGCHYATRKPVRVRWQGSRIVSLEPAADAPAGTWVAPALFDLQVNGFGGVDFQQDNLEVEHLLDAARHLAAAGCTRFLLTLITDDWQRQMSRLARMRVLRAQSPELQQAIAGWHIEGPFLSGEPGFVGTHNAELVRDPKPADISELRAIAGNDLVLLTLAPERTGAIDVIKLATERGIKVSLGHTNASADILAQAIAAGAIAFTHLGNGCPANLDRHDNILWRVLDTPGLAVSLIPDRIHVSPSLFRLVHRALADRKLFYVTDAMSAAGAAPGRYKLGSLTLEVGADQVVRRPGTPYLSGSALRPVDGVFRAAAMLGCRWQDAWTRFSEAPAGVIGLQNTLATGQSSRFCVLRLGPKDEVLEVKCAADLDR
jgi:N-acetylglucosamine-6-phosphate deacetylase